MALGAKTIKPGGDLEDGGVKKWLKGREGGRDGRDGRIPFRWGLERETIKRGEGVEKVS